MDIRKLHLGNSAAGVPINLSATDRLTHMYIPGASGTGKSKFFEWMMRGDLRNGQGFCLLDPHGTLYDTVADYAAHHVLNREIILLNVSKPDAVIGFNPFRKACDCQFYFVFGRDFPLEHCLSSFPHNELATSFPIPICWRSKGRIPYHSGFYK